MTRQPTTARGSRTVEGLLDHALGVFAARGYHATSISAICREAGVANASFYQYFRDKQEVFAALAVHADEVLGAALARAHTLDEMVAHLFDSLEANGRLFQVIREAEFLGEAATVRAFYAPLVARVQALLGVDEPTAWSLLGAQIFVALRFAVWGGGRVGRGARRTFTDFARAGIGTEAIASEDDLHLPAPSPLPATPTSVGTDAARPLRVPDPSLLPATPTADPRLLRVPHLSPTPPAADPANGTRRLLLDAARACFADRGYTATHVADITRRADVAQGTFYRHFPAKRDVLAAVLEAIRADLTARTASAQEGALGRLEAERRNLLVFLEGVRRDPDIYRIVREAEFAEPAIGRGFYVAIAAEYASVLREAQARGEVRDGDAETLAWAVMGIAHTAGMRWVLWERARPAPPEALRSTLRFLLGGLAPP